MHKTTQNRPKSFTVIYVIALAFVAMTCALAVLADTVPGVVAPLLHGVDTEVAVFVVPLAMLMFAIIAEVVHVSLSGSLPDDARAKARAVRAWAPGRGEG